MCIVRAGLVKKSLEHACMSVPDHVCASAAKGWPSGLVPRCMHMCVRWCIGLVLCACASISPLQTANISQTECNFETLTASCSHEHVMRCASKLTISGWLILLSDCWVCLPLLALPAGKEAVTWLVSDLFCFSNRKNVQHTTQNKTVAWQTHLLQPSAMVKDRETCGEKMRASQPITAHTTHCNPPLDPNMVQRELKYSFPMVLNSFASRCSSLHDNSASVWKIPRRNCLSVCVGVSNGCVLTWLHRRSRPQCQKPFWSPLVTRRASRLWEAGAPRYPARHLRPTLCAWAFSPPAIHHSVTTWLLKPGQPTSTGSQQLLHGTSVSLIATWEHLFTWIPASSLHPHTSRRCVFFMAMATNFWNKTMAFTDSCESWGFHVAQSLGLTPCLCLPWIPLETFSQISEVSRKKRGTFVAVCEPGLGID